MNIQVMLVKRDTQYELIKAVQPIAESFCINDSYVKIMGTIVSEMMKPHHYHLLSHVYLP